MTSLKHEIACVVSLCVKWYSAQWYLVRVQLPKADSPQAFVSVAASGLLGKKASTAGHARFVRLSGRRTSAAAALGSNDANEEAPKEAIDSAIDAIDAPVTRCQGQWRARDASVMHTLMYATCAS